MRKFKFRERRNSFKKIKHLAQNVFNNRYNAIFKYNKRDIVKIGVFKFVKNLRES